MGIINANKTLMNDRNEPTSVKLNFHRVTEIHINDKVVNFEVLGYESQQAYENGSGHLKRENFSYPRTSGLDLFSEADQRLAGTSITTLIEDELVADTTNLSQEAINLRFIGFLTNGTKV